MGMVKDEAKEIVDNLPEQATWDDVMYQFYVKKKIATSISAAEEGIVISHEDVKKRLYDEMNIRWTAARDMNNINPHPWEVT